MTKLKQKVSSTKSGNASHRNAKQNKWKQDENGITRTNTVFFLTYMAKKTT